MRCAGLRHEEICEGFWLPRALRSRYVGTRTDWEELRFARGRECGRECPDDEPGAVTAGWPRLDKAAWADLLEGLRAARDKAPRGEDYWERLQAALPLAAGRLSDPSDPAHLTFLDALSRYTGYSPAMIASALGTPGMWDLRKMAASFAHLYSRSAAAVWQTMPGLAGRVRFFPDSPFGRVMAQAPVWLQTPFFGPVEAPSLVLGYGAGNVPGTALMIVLLALSTALAGGAPPVTVVRNSRREPIFSPLVLSALEQVDEELVSTVAVLVWDYDDARLQEYLLSQAGLVVAAAGDDTIARIAAQIASVGDRSGKPRFHPHGHKVSFSVIGREMFEQTTGPLPGDPSAQGSGDLVDAVAKLAALDSAFWDQNGCLSSRIHFVETDKLGEEPAAAYAERLTAQMRELSHALPRGAWPLRELHNRFDRYKAIEAMSRPGAGLRVLSRYDDAFVVVLDQRITGRSRLDSRVLAGLVNDCQGRLVVVTPVDNITEVPRDYLGLLPSHSLQSLSVAVGRPGQGLSSRFLDFATACGARGVTAIRVVGRGAFPQLAYSWDGLLPLDLVRRRPPGHFTTIEFDSPFEDMMETYRAHLGRLGRLSA